MLLRIFGGLTVSTGPDQPVVAVSGATQQRLLIHLATEPGRRVSYRALADELWPDALPDDTRAALQSAVSRLRRQLPADIVETVDGGYRLRLDPADIDFVVFQAEVAHAEAAAARGDHSQAAAHAREALRLHVDDPWLPDELDWLGRDLARDLARAEALAGVEGASASGAIAASPIPASRTVVLGRADERGMLARQLATNRLVTILGTGGVGKTTLATQAARDAPDAVLVELAPVAGGGVTAAVAAPFARVLPGSDLGTGVPSRKSSESSLSRIIDALWGRGALLVIDNCEHVIAEVAQLVDALIGAVPDLTVLTTSREPLGVAGEAFVALGPLDPETASELFAARVEAASGHRPRPEDSPVVEAIVDRLDRLPLAIELAAARARTLSLTEIRDGLDNRFALLSGGPRTVPRHQTLKALIDWSWELLDADERDAIGVAALAPAGLDPHLARTLEEASGFTGVFDALVDKSMLYRSSGRIRALETVREYMRDRFTAAQVDAATARLADAISVVASAMDEKLRTPGRPAALQWFVDDRENRRFVLDWCASHRQWQRGVRLFAQHLWCLVDDGYGADSDEWMLPRAAVFGDPTTRDWPAVPLAELTDDDALSLFITDCVGAAMRLLASPADPAAAAARELAYLQTFADRVGPLLRDAQEPRSDVAALLSVAVAHAAATADQLVDFRAWAQFSDGVPAGEDFGVSPWACVALRLLSALTLWNAGHIGAFERELALLSQMSVSDPWLATLEKRCRIEWLTLTGQLDEALALSRETDEHADARRRPLDDALWRRRIVEILIRMGRLDEAAAEVDHLFSLVRGDAMEVGIAHWAAAQLAWSMKDARAAHEHGELAFQLLQFFVLRTPQGLAEVHISRALAYELTADFSSALSEVAAGVEAAVASADRPVTAEAVLAAGVVVSSLDAECARETLDLAIDVCGVADVTSPYAARIRKVLGLPHPPASQRREPVDDEAVARRITALVERLHTLRL